MTTKKTVMTTCLLQKDKKCEPKESTKKKEIKGEKRRKKKIMGHSIIDLLKVKGMTTCHVRMTVWKKVECEPMENFEKKN